VEIQAHHKINFTFETNTTVKLLLIPMKDSSPSGSGNSGGSGAQAVIGGEALLEATTTEDSTSTKKSPLQEPPKAATPGDNRRQ